MEPILYVAAAVAAVTAAVAAAANRLHWPAPVLLVLAGLCLALAPGIPRVELPPDLVLLVFLPPLIYYAAFGMSWQAFRKNLRPILLLAVGCVIFTSAAVAVAAHFVAGLPWAVAFVLGAIVSPPDAVAPLAIVRRLGVPSRIAEVLEGEGLVNDATALVLFKFALAAATTGAFSLAQAGATFAAVVVGETLWGVFIGWLLLQLRHLAHEPRIEVTLSLLTPYLAFWGPHAVGGSGVLATVIAGLYVGARGIALIRSATRLQAIFFWDFLNYLLTGAIFLLTGLQARAVLDGLRGAPLGALLRDGLVLSLIVVLVRFLWVLPLAYVPRWLFRRIGERDPAPPWQYLFAIAFVGVRGVVSLAAALSIPLGLGPAQPLLERGRVLFLTFGIILFTLVVQGPTLAPVVRWLGLDRHGRRERYQRRVKETDAELAAARAALGHVDRVASEQALAPELAGQLRTRHEQRVGHLERLRDTCGDGERDALRAEAGELALLATERAHVNGLAREGKISDEIRRRIERGLDLREELLRRTPLGLAEDVE